MKLGIFNMGTGISDPASLRRIAEAAEASGLESLWCGEHVVLPKPRVAPSPADPEHHFLHPSVVLAYLAACTETLKLGTGIVLIAQRNPLVLAKEFASVDVVSGGRVILGIGAGYLEPEFEAIGAPFRERGRRTDEAIDAMRALWNKPIPASRASSGSSVGSTRIPGRPVRRACRFTSVGTQRRRSRERRSAVRGGTAGCRIRSRPRTTFGE